MNFLGVANYHSDEYHSGLLACQLVNLINSSTCCFKKKFKFIYFYLLLSRQHSVLISSGKRSNYKHSYNDYMRTEVRTYKFAGFH